MGLRIIKLSKKERESLVLGYEKGKSSAYRKRCHIILLKSDGRSSKDVGSIVGCCDVSVNAWLNRYESEGIDGLKTRSGRGRKPILDVEKDAEKVKSVVKNERQKLSNAKVILEQELAKSFSLETLKRYIKNLVANGNELENVLRKS